MEIQTEGAVATERHRDGAAGGSYGYSASDVARRNDKRLRADRVNTALATVTDSLDDVLMQVMADAKHEYRNPKEVAALVRHVQGEANRRRMAKIEADDRATATFVETSTPAAVAGLVEHAPDLQRWAPMVKAYPLAPHVTVLCRDQPAVAEQAVKLVAAADALLHGHTRSITSVAQNHVTHGCRLIRGADSETGTGATINAESPCFVDGFCSCTYRGRTIRNIRNSMHGCLTIFSRSGRQRGGRRQTRASTLFA